MLMKYTSFLYINLHGYLPLCGTHADATQVCRKCKKAPRNFIRRRDDIPARATPRRDNRFSQQKKIPLLCRNILIN